MAELFESYKIRQRTRRGRWLATTVAGSIVVHSLLVGAIVYVPGLRDTLHLANIFSNAEYADEAYQDLAIRENKGLVYVADASTLFQYPSGYFAPEAPPVAIEKPAPTPVPTPTPRPTPKASPQPKPSPTTQSNKPDGDEAVAADGQSGDEEKLEAVTKKASEVKFQRPNVRPFKDWLADAKRMMDAGELDLSGTLTMTLEGERNPDGTLSKVRVVQVSAGNPNLKKLALDFISKLSASRVLAPLDGVKQMRMTVRLDEQNVSARIDSRMESEEHARARSQGLNAALFGFQIMRAGTNEGKILGRTKISARGRELIVRFDMPRNDAGALLAKQLP